ncbi:MAG: porin [Holosporaceae bacterium]|jgi:predicted porin|nr:porin [Holosporaceae bacterium]
MFRSAILAAMFLSMSLFAATRDFERSDEVNRRLPLNELINDELTKYDVDATLRLCGRLHFTTIFINQDRKTDRIDAAVTSLKGDIYFKYLGKRDEYGYGFEMAIKANSGVIKQGNAVVRASFIFLESDKMGTLRLGYTNTAADLFSICGDKCLVGYLGAGSGDLGAFYDKSAGSIVDTGFPQDDSRAAKIVWISPIISGISAGLSFTLDSRDANLFRTRRHGMLHIHEKANFFGLGAAYSKNLISGGIAYEFGAPDGLNAKISGAVWLGKGKSGFGDDIKARNVRAHNIGAIVGYKKFKLSAGYTDNGKSLLAEKQAISEIAAFDDSRNYDLADPDVGLQSGADAGKIYSLGISYSFDKLGVSAGYFKSIVKFSPREKSKADVISLAAEYKFDQNLRIYLEYDHIATNSCDMARAYGKACNLTTMGKIKAYLFMIGSKINF